MSYYVYQLVDPRNNLPFYIGRGIGDRAFQHIRLKDGNQNLYKDRKIKKILKMGLVPLVQFLHENIEDEELAYSLEKEAIQQIGIKNLTNMTDDRNPPSRKGWSPSPETLKKRSNKLKGLPRTTEWRKNLSLSKQGEKNGMFGKKEPCNENRRLSIIKAKNEKNYDLYKQAIILMNQGISADNVAKKLLIGRGICFRLKNKSHQIFIAFPELVKLFRR